VEVGQTLGFSVQNFDSKNLKSMDVNFFERNNGRKRLLERNNIVHEKSKKSRKLI